MTPIILVRRRFAGIALCVLALCLLLTGAGVPASVQAEQPAYRLSTGITVSYPAGWTANEGNLHAPSLPDDLVTFCSEPNVHDVSLVVLRASDLALTQVAVNLETRTFGVPAERSWVVGLPEDQVGCEMRMPILDGHTLIRESRFLRLGDRTVWLFTQYSDEADMADLAAERSSVLASMASSLVAGPAAQLPLEADYVALDLPSAPDRRADGPRPATASFVWPTTGYLGFIYGRPVDYLSKGYHDAVDIFSSMPAGNGRGNEIYAVYQGTVYSKINDPRTGHEIGVIIQHASVGRYSLYLHMGNEANGESYVSCSVGQSVTSDTRIGWQGDHRYNQLGDCITHLHLMIMDGPGWNDDIDPSPYFGLRLNWNDPDHLPAWHYIERGDGGGDIPAKPSWVNATTNLSDKIQVTWASSSGATHYDLYRMDTPTGVHEGAWRRNALSGTSYDDTTAERDRDYYYWVTACNSHGCSNDPAGDYGTSARGRRTDGGGGDVTGTSWQASYMRSDTCWNDHSQCNNPTYTEVLPFPGGNTLFSKDWGNRSPGSSTPEDNWTGMFQGTVTFTPGYYVFYADHDDGLKMKFGTTEHNKDSAGTNSMLCNGPNGYYMSGATPITLYLREDGGDARLNLRWSTDCTPCQPPAVPSGVNATDDQYTDKVRITWNASSGATRYEVWRATSSGGSKAKLGEPTGITYDDNSAVAGTTYYYWVKACGSNGCSDFSSYDTGRRGSPVVVPNAPANVAATDGNFTSMVRVTWNASSGATGYKVFRATSSGGAKVLLGERTGTYWEDSSAIPGTTYYYWVQACNSAGCSTYSSWDTGYRFQPVVIPVAPTGVSASDGDHTDRVRLTWSASAGATRYEIYRATSSTGAKSYLGYSTNTTGDDVTVAPGVTYYYWIKACNDAGCSDFSSYNTGYCAAPIPNAPGNVAATDGDYSDKVRVAWNSSSGATRYEVYRATSSGGSKVKLGESTGTSYDDTTAVYGTTYYYWVKACNSTGCSGYSSWDTGRRAMPTASYPVQLYRDAAYGDGYCYRTGAGQGNFLPGCSTYVGQVSSFLLQDGWSLRVYKNADWTGNWVCFGASDSDLSNNFYADGTTVNDSIRSYELYHADNCSPVVTVPAAPANVSASDGDYIDRVRVSWSASSGATRYEVYRATSSTGTKSKLGEASSTSYDDTSAAVAATYYYWIKACNSAGCSGYSSWDTGRAASIPCGPPEFSAPGDGATVGSRTVTLRWTEPVCTGLTGYTLRVTTGSGPEDGVILDLGVGGSSHGYTFPGDGTFYWHMASWANGQRSSWVSRRIIVDTVSSDGDSYEPDDTRAAAKPITSGQAQTHSIMPVGDEDWMTFTLTQESEVVIETSGAAGNDTRMWLYDSVGGQVEYDDDDGTSVYSRIGRMCDEDALPAGSYYILVDEYGDSDEIEAYQILLTVEPCDPAPVCTPPPCPPPGVLICPPGQDCPGGCGVICYPSVYPTPVNPKTPRGWLPLIKK